MPKRPEINYARFPQFAYKAIVTHPEGVDKEFVQKYNRLCLRTVLGIPSEEVYRRENSLHSVYDTDANYALRSLEVSGLIYRDSHKRYHATQKYYEMMKSGVFRNMGFWEAVRSFYKNDVVRKGSTEESPVEKYFREYEASKN